LDFAFAEEMFMVVCFT